MALPPVPPSPMGPGGTAPAAPMQQQRPAQESRQNVLMGLALWFASQAHAAAPMSEHAPDIGGFDGQSAWGAHTEFTVTPPTKIRTAEKSSGRSDD